MAERRFLPTSTEIDDAVSALVAEHGAPNSFACSDVAAVIGCRATEIGRTQKYRRFTTFTHDDGWTSRYLEGRFVVTDAKEARHA